MKLVVPVRREFFWILASLLFIFLLASALPKVTSDLMLRVIEWRAKVDIQYQKKETMGLFWVHLTGLSVGRGPKVRVTARDAVIQYNILHLIFKRLDLKLTAHDLKYESSDSITRKAFLESFEFDELISNFQLASKRRIRIDYLRLSGDMGSIFLKGRLQEKVDLDLNFACFLKQDFLVRLPKFIQENLFRDTPLPYKRFRFRLEGNWFRPSIDFQSDLVEFNFKSRV